MLRNGTVERCRVGPCTKDSRYECPRCATKYCSVACYRQHSEKCVRAFAEQADENLRGLNVSELDKKLTSKKLRDTLQQLDEEHPLIEQALPEALSDLTLCAEATLEDENGDKSESDEDGENWIGCAARGETDHDGEGDYNGGDNTVDIADVLEDVLDEMEEGNPSFEDVIDRLPKCMVEEFYEMVHDGRIGRFLPLWRPWWLQSRIAEGGIVEDPESAVLPPKPEEGTLSCPIHVASRKASPNILYSVVDVVYGYCLMMRVHNGDWQADCTGATRFMWEVGGVLAEDARHITMQDALNNCVQRGLKVTRIKGAALEAIADTSAIFGGRKDWLSRALWEVCNLLKKTEEDCKGHRSREIAKRKLKIGFFLSWVLSMDDQVFLVASRKISSYLVREQETKEQLDRARRALELSNTDGKSVPISLP